MMQMLFDGTFWDAVTKMSLIQMFFVIVVVAMVGATLVGMCLAIRFGAMAKIANCYFDYRKLKLQLSHRDTTMAKKKKVDDEILPEIENEDAAPLDEENEQESSNGGEETSECEEGTDEGEAEIATDHQTDHADEVPDQDRRFLCDCGASMDILKRTTKRRFDLKNKVTYYDAMQCHCPKCHRVKEVASG